MTLQQLKEKVNGWFQAKSPTERQKMVKYAVVMPAAIISGIVIIWLIFGGFSKGGSLIGNAFNMEIPDGEKSKVGTKAEEYAIADLEKQHEANQVVVEALDTIAPVDQDTVVTTSAIEQSANQYQEVCQSLNEFYIPEDNSAAQVAELQNRIDELEAQNSIAQQQSQPNELELMEQSYRMAARYLGNGGQAAAVIVDESDKEKRDVKPVTQVTRNVVSSLAASADAPRTFATAVGGTRQNYRNTVSACVACEQSIVDGESVKLRTLEPMWIGKSLLPRNSTVVGKARVLGERLEIKIESIEASGCIMDVDLAVYDSDGQQGINIPNSLESDALHEIGANMGSSMGSTINLSTNAGAQLASDVGKGLINGVSQYLNKKLRTVKVHLKAGYKVMLKQNEQ